MLQPFENEKIQPQEQIIARRSFQCDNLSLHLIHDTHFDLFRIQVFRHNDQSTHDLWGCWFVGDDDSRGDIQLAATQKFRSIQL